MRIADRIVFYGAQPEPLAGVIGRLLQPPIVERQRLGLAVFQEQFPVVGPGKPARQLMAHLVTVEMGAVEQGGCRGHGGLPLRVMESKIVALRPFREGAKRLPANETVTALCRE